MGNRAGSPVRKMEEEHRETLWCARCHVPLKMETVHFSYIGHVFQKEVLCCPVCHNVYLPPELVNGQMADLEMALEDK